MTFKDITFLLIKNVLQSNLGELGGRVFSSPKAGRILTGAGNVLDSLLWINSPICIDMVLAVCSGGSAD